MVGTLDADEFVIDQRLVEGNQRRGTDLPLSQTGGGVEDGGIGHQTGIDRHKEVVRRALFDLYLGIFEDTAQRRVAFARGGLAIVATAGGGANPEKFEVVLDEGQRRRGVDVPAQVAEQYRLHVRHVEGIERSTGQLGDHDGRYRFALIHLDR